MKRDFLRLLKELEHDELRDEMKSLYDRFPVVREYYKLELSGNTKAVLDKYKNEIRKAFFPSRSYRMNRRARSASNKVIKGFSEVSIHQRDLIELHFYRVMVMVEAISHYYVESEAFFDSTISYFEKACGMAHKELMLETFHPVAEAITEAFEDGPNYGFYSLRDVYEQYWGVGN